VVETGPVESCPYLVTKLPFMPKYGKKWAIFYQTSFYHLFVNSRSLQEVKELKRKPDCSPDASPQKKKCNKENLSPAREEVSKGAGVAG